MKWEKTLTDYHSGNYLPSFEVQEELNVSRIFRRLYKETIQFVGRHQDRLNSIFREADHNEMLQMMEAYCRVGLHVEAIVMGNNF